MTDNPLEVAPADETDVRGGNRRANRYWIVGYMAATVTKYHCKHWWACPLAVLVRIANHQEQ
jgi:hypothetical protein